MKGFKGDEKNLVPNSVSHRQPVKLKHDTSDVIKLGEPHYQRSSCILNAVALL